MNGLGRLLKEQRESKGVSIEEASNDLSIKDVILENIEEGNLGAFKDIYALKDNMKAYAKYLGLNPDSIIDEFNSYLFEYTSKIPLKKIEKEMEKENEKNEKESVEAVSPYTKPARKHSKKYLVLIYALAFFFVLMILIWSVSQITVKTKTTSDISYIK